MTGVKLEFGEITKTEYISFVANINNREIEGTLIIYRNSEGEIDDWDIEIEGEVDDLEYKEIEEGIKEVISRMERGDAK